MIKGEFDLGSGFFSSRIKFRVSGFNWLTVGDYKLPVKWGVGLNLSDAGDEGDC